jgi:tRNA dimethylallyltransferase
VQTIFLLGPTAAGKSAVALELARKLGADVVSADSMQVYRGMDIGTAKACSEERGAIRHHLIDVCDINEPFDVKRFVGLASAALDDIRARGKCALVVGGTGLYVRALRHGLFEGPSRDAKLRAELERKPAAELFAELQRVDPRTAARIDQHNPRRLVRALEVFYETGKPIAELQTQWKTPHLNPALSGIDPLPLGERRFPSPRLRGSRVRETPLSSAAKGLGEGCVFCLNRERDDLYARIEQRIDRQIAAGWVDEVRALMARGLEQNAMAMQAAGYRELVSHLHGELSLAEVVKLIKTRTRQLARRQLTWFRHEPDVTWIEISKDETAAETARRVLAMLPKEMAKV